MKNLGFSMLAAVMAVVSLPTIGPAADPAPAPAATWTVTPAVVSTYMFRGMRFGGPAFQPTVELGYGNLTGGIWASVPLEDKVPGLSDPEIDFYGGYTVPLGEAVNVVAGATWYTFPRAEERAGFYKQTFEPNLALNYTVNGLRLTPKVYYDIVLRGATAELGASYALPLTAWGTELDLAATAGTFKWRDAVERAAAPVRNWGSYWSAGASVPIQVSAHGKVSLGLSYVRGYDNYLKQPGTPKAANALATGRGVASIAYALTF